MERPIATRLLLKAGIDPDHFDESARYVFLTACKDGPDALIEAFLAAGIPLRHPEDREPPIVKAAEGGSIERIELLLAHGASLDERDQIGDTPLHTAANWGHAPLIRALLSRGASSQTVNRKGWTPLSQAVHGASKSGDLEVVASLLEGGADPNFSGVDLPPLGFALERPELVELLLRWGADPSFVDKEGESLLLQATRRDLRETVRLLLAYGARDVPNRHGWTAWMLAKALELEQVRQILEEGGVERRDIGFYAAITAAKVGNLPELQRLLARESRWLDCVDWSGSTPLIWAAAHQHEHVAAWLLGRGADPGATNDARTSALVCAVRDKKLSFVDFLLASGAPADQGPDHSQALLVAATGPLDILQRLLAAGATVDSVDRHGQTPLYLAASQNLEDNVVQLLQAGANPNGARPDVAPLLLAARRGHVECVRRLCEAGADLDLQEPLLGETALLRAAGVYKNEDARLGEVVRVLLDAGADWKRHGKFGTDTPYVQARSNDNGPCIAVLTERLTTGWLGRFTGQDGTLDAAAAARAADPEVLRVLIEEGFDAPVLAMVRAGLDPSLLLQGPRPPLFAALTRPDPSLASALLDHVGPDPALLALTEFNTNVLIAAAGAGHLEIVRRLIAAGAEVNAVVGPYNDTAMARAASHGHIPVMEALFEAGGRVNLPAAGWTPLMRAAQSGQLEAAKWLLAHGANPAAVTTDGSTPLEVARQAGHDAVVTAIYEGSLLEPTDARGRTTLFGALLAGNTPLARELLERGADPDRPDQEGVTPAMVARLRRATAALVGEPFQPLAPDPLPPAPQAFRALHRGELSPSALSGIDIHAVDARGDTLLHHACRRGLRGLATALLEHGADPQRPNARGETPWALAVVWSGERELPNLVLAQGGRLDPNDQARVMLNYEPFRDALDSGDLARMAQVMRDGAVPLDALSSHHSPLGLALFRRDREMVELLLALGADPLALSGQKTPLALAESLGEHELAELLRAHATPSVPLPEPRPEPVKIPASSKPPPPVFDDSAWRPLLPPRLPPEPPSPSPEQLARAKEALSALSASAGGRSWRVARQARWTRRALEAIAGIDPARFEELRADFEAVAARVGAPRGERLPLWSVLELLLELDACVFARTLRAWNLAGASGTQRFSVLLEQLHPELALRLMSALADPRCSKAVCRRRLERIRPALDVALAEQGSSVQTLLEAVAGSASLLGDGRPRQVAAEGEQTSLS